MPLRQRLRKALRRMSIGSAEDVEPVPKYKEPVDPEHRDRLEAFSFGSQRRRPSSQSQISPRASLAASRKGSMLSILSAGRRATQTAQQATVAEEAEGGVNDGHKEPVSLGHGKVGESRSSPFAPIVILLQVIWCY